MNSTTARALTGLAAVVAIIAVIAVTIGLFRGSFTETVPVTVVSDRAGLVMNPDAKVKMRGVEVGRVASIAAQPDGKAVLKLDMNPTQLHLIPSNVGVDITSSTVFGAKYVELVPPKDPSPQELRSGQVIEGQHVTIEVNTVFQQLVTVLDKIDPAKLNETLGAVATAFNGRGEKIGRTLSDFNAFLAKINPSLPNLTHDIEASVPTASAYGDAAPDLISTADNAIRLSNSIVDEATESRRIPRQLNRFGRHRQRCDRRQPAGADRRATRARADHEPARAVPRDAGLHHRRSRPVRERHPISTRTSCSTRASRWASSATATRGPAEGRGQTGGRSFCQEFGLPNVPAEFRPPFIVADTGSNPFKYGNQGMLLNSDGLKQWLFGPIDGTAAQQRA